MKTSWDIIAYAACIILFAGYKTAELFDPALPLLHDHFEDLLALPVILKSAQLSMRVVVPRFRNYVIPLRDGLLILLAFSLYYEMYLPVYDPRFTADILDVFCYAAGFVIFECCMNKTHKVSHEGFSAHLWRQ